MRRIVSLWLSRFTTDRLHRLRRGGLPPKALAAPAAEVRIAASAGDGSASGAGMVTAPPVPLATVAAGRGGLRLVAIDAAARNAGLRPGLSLAEARALAPLLQAEPADPRADRRALSGLAEWCGRYTPWAAVDPDESDPGACGGGGGLLLDVSGCAHLFGGEAMMLEDLTGRIRRQGFACSAAIAGTTGAAWALARFAGEATVYIAKADLAAELAPLPVRALRLTPEMAVSLHRLGIRRVGDLTGLPRGPLAARFGEPLLRRLDQALGRIDEPLSPRRPPSAFCARLAFAEPIGRNEDVARAVDHLLVNLCGRLEAAGRGARHLDLAAYRTDGGVARTAIGTSRPTRAANVLQRLFREKLEHLDPGFGIEVMTLAAVIADPLPPAQVGLGTDDAAARQESLAQLVDRLGNRLGTGAVIRLAEHPSHLPERACREVPAMASLPSVTSPSPSPAPPQTPSSSARRSKVVPADEQDHRSRQPRPPQLLASPEPITVIAPVPDGPPVLFRWRHTRYLVATAEGPERIAPEWWLLDGGHDPEQLARIRDYYRVEDVDGLRFWIFREGLYRPDRPPCWYLHGMFG